MIVICKSCGKKTPEGKLCQICGAFLAPPVPCPGCGRATAAGTTKCAYCGAAIVPVKAPDLIDCPKCGRKVAPHLPKCQMCGTPIAAAKAAAGGAADPKSRLNFEQAMEKALQHARAGQFQDAIPYLDRALVFQAGHPDVWAIKGSCLHNLGRFADALPCYQQSVRIRPDDPATLFNLGNTLRLLLRLEDAAGCYERAARLNPLNADVHANYALLLRNLGRYGEAIPACHVVLGAKPDAHGFLNCLGFCLFSVGKADQALTPLRRATELDPRRPGYWIDLGLCLEALRKQDEADDCFEKASQADPIGARANHHQALLLERRGRKPQAAEHFYRAGVGYLIEQRKQPLSLQSQNEHRAAREGLQRLRAHLARSANPNALFVQALQAEAESRWDDAMALYEEVSVFVPENEFAAEGAARMRLARKGEGAPLPAVKRLGEAIADLQTQDAPRGIRTLDELLASDFPPRAFLHVLKGRGLLRLGRLDEAVSAFAQAPDDAAAWAGKAEALAAKGDLDGAASSAEQALKRDPRDPAAWTARGGVLLRKGRPADALEVFVKATSIDSAFAAAWAGKAEAEDALGRIAAAQQSYEKLLELRPDPDRKASAETRLKAIEAGIQAGVERFQKAVENVTRGNAAEGVAVLDEMLAKPDAPEQDTLWYLKGKGLARLGRFDEALACHDRSIALAPAKSSGWSGKAEVHEGRGDDARALECAEEALKRAADHPSWTVKGNCLRRAGKLPEALEAFGRALQHQADFDRALLGKAETEDALGRLPAALQTYLAFLALKPPAAARVAARVTELLPQVPLAGPIEMAERGIALQKCGRFDDALSVFLRITEIDPKAAGPWIGVANVYRDLNRYDEALQAIDRALQPNPRDRDTVLIKSFILHCAGREAEARACMEKLGAVDAVRDAERLSRERKHEEALARLDKAIAVDPDFDEAWCGKGQVLQILGRRSEALAAFERAVKLNSEYRQALGGLGESLIHARRFQEAEPYLVRCVEKKPEDPKPHLYLAHAREMTGRKDVALEGYARFLWGATESMKEQIQFARQQHQALVEALRPPQPKIAPSPAASKMNAAYEHLQRGRIQDAIKAFDDVLKADPYAIVALLNKGQCLADLGRTDEAMRCFEQGVKLAPKYVGAWIMRGTCLTGLDRMEESLASFEKALQLDPFESAAWGNRAACLNALHRPAEALPCIERALVLDPYNVVAWFNKGDTEHALKKTAEAAASFRRFLAIAPAGAEDFVEKARAALREIETGVSAAAPTVLEIAAEPMKAIGSRYEVYKELGRGGFGVVYLAVERKLQEVCALKTFLDERAADAESIRMFKSEARTWINLDAHPHLVRAYTVDEIDGRLYIAMELIAPGPDGCNTLEGYLRTNPPGLNQSLRWSIQFCHGMEYAYTKGIRCHRDIKPANIMIDARKCLKISDFGLAAGVPSKPGAARLQMRDGSVGLSVHGEGGGAGTPTHMPPEQWRSGAACDERSDLYAFGVTLYQMATKGKLPFLPALPRSAAPQEQTRFMAELYRMHVTASPPPLDSPLWPMIERCLRKNPAERYGSFRDLRSELEPLLKGQAQGETVPAPAIGRMDAGDLVNKALSLDALGRTDDALRRFDEALKMEPGSVLALAGKGSVLARTGKLADALAILDQAVERDPKSTGSHAAKANALSQAGRHKESLAAYERAIELESSNPVIWRNKARCLRELGRLDEALKAFDQALSIESGSAIGWADRSCALRDAGRHAEAVEGFRKCIALDPSRATAWSLMGESLAALQRFDEALASFEQAVALDPSNYNTWVNRGGCLAVAGRIDDAMASYDRAIPLSPQPAMAWNNKGDLYVRMKQLDRAMECFDRALQIEPGMILATQNKALRLRDQGKVDEALALLKRSVEAHPESSALWYFTGEFLVLKQKPEPAIAAYRKVLETERSNARALAMALCHMAECCEKLDRIAEALEAFRKAAEILPNYKEAREGAERCRG